MIYAVKIPPGFHNSSVSWLYNSSFLVLLITTQSTAQHKPVFTHSHTFIHYWRKLSCKIPHAHQQYTHKLHGPGIKPPTFWLVDDHSHLSSLCTSRNFGLSVTVEKEVCHYCVIHALPGRVMFGSVFLHSSTFDAVFREGVDNSEFQALTAKPCLILEDWRHMTVPASTAVAPNAVYSCEERTLLGCCGVVCVCVYEWEKEKGQQG